MRQGTQRRTRTEKGEREQTRQAGDKAASADVWDRLRDRRGEGMEEVGTGICIHGEGEETSTREVPTHGGHAILQDVDPVICRPARDGNFYTKSASGDRF